MLTVLWFLLWFFVGVIARERRPIDGFSFNGGSWGPILRPAAVVAVFAAILAGLPPPFYLILVGVPAGLAAGWAIDTVGQDLCWSSAEAEYERMRFMTSSYRSRSLIFV